MTETYCNGMCVTGADIGVGTYEQIAYPHPLCEAHAVTPCHEYTQKSVQELHNGPMGVCECGAYKDEHEKNLEETPRIHSNHL